MGLSGSGGRLSMVRGFSGRSFSSLRKLERSSLVRSATDGGFSGSGGAGPRPPPPLEGDRVEVKSDIVKSNPIVRRCESDKDPRCVDINQICAIQLEQKLKQIMIMGIKIFAFKFQSNV